MMAIVAGAVCDRCGENKMYSHIGKIDISKWVIEDRWSVTRKNGRDVVLCSICKHKRKER